MDGVTIPVVLSLEESTAIALVEAADALSYADDHIQRLAALDTNHRLWLILTDLAQQNGWRLPDRRPTDYAINTARRAGKPLSAELISALVDMNRRMSERLTGGRDLAAIRRRAHLAWEERGRPYGLRLQRWLVYEMERKAQIH